MTTAQIEAIIKHIGDEWTTLHELRAKIPLGRRITAGRRDNLTTQVLALVRAGLVEERGGCADGGKRSFKTEWAKETYQIRRKP